jgi:hypothetical protein
MSTSSATSRFRRQHADLARLAAQVVAELDPVAMATDSRPVRVSLAVLVGKLRIHAAMEDEALYPRLYAHAEPSLRALGLQFRAEFGEVYASFLAFLEAWNAAAIEAHPSAFAVAARAALSALGTRVRLENEVLYEALDEAEGRVP